MIKRWAALAISLAVGGYDLMRRQVQHSLNRPARCRGVVLYYHGVTPQQRLRFAGQMDELLKCARPFQAGSPETMVVAGRNVAVTFDDGFESVVENAVPELVRRDIPFTLFVPSGCLGERPSWVNDPTHPSREQRVLSATALRALASVPLATIGSHSISHRRMSDLDSDDAALELVRSKADLETAVGATVDLFSFPHGAYTAALLDQARRVGYRRVFTIEPTMAEADPCAFTVGRVAAHPDDWPLEFRLKIAGAYRWRRWRHRLRQVA